jgi:alkylation response protein AidB-like acyl-CoA dehydrogenase
VSTVDTIRYADYSLTEEQQALAEVFGSFFERESPVERVRAAEPLGFDRELWQHLSELRAVAMGVPEAQGGDGAGLAELVLVTEALGRHVAPVPLVEAAAAARLLVRAGGADELLFGVTGGEQLPTLALHPGVPGRPQFVPAAAVADVVVGLVGDELVVTRPSGPPRAPANQGSAPVAWWDPGAPGTDTTVLSRGAEAAAAFAEAVREWQVLMAGALIGLADGALRIGVEHARSREAFGALIGSFQAVAHPLVDVAMAVETGRRLLYKAAWTADHDPAIRRQLVPMAYLHATETAMRAGTVGVHVLGGVGFTLEGDEQLYFRRAKGWTLVAGDPQGELARIADVLYGPAR